MMPSLNKVFLIGHLGHDPEMRHTSTGKVVCNMSVATSERRGAGTFTEWHTVICWEKQAEFASQFLKKGDPVYVEGRLQTREWEDKGLSRKKTEIIAFAVQSLGPNQGKRLDAQEQKPAPSEYEEDDLAF